MHGVAFTGIPPPLTDCGSEAMLPGNKWKVACPEGAKRYRGEDVLETVRQCRENRALNAREYTKRLERPFTGKNLHYR